MKNNNPHNNFDFLRLVFASLVIITHSYLLTGHEEKDWLYYASKGHWAFSKLGVNGFFVISGYLVYESMLRSTGFINYFSKRFLRLFPALIVVLVLTALLGYFVYDGSHGPYFSNPSVWSYVPNNVKLINLQLGIPGVFENNPYPSNINGSLWTLKYEFICYVLLSLLLLVKSSRTKAIIITVLFVVLLIAGQPIYTEAGALQFYDLNGNDLFNFVLYFMTGAFLHAINIQKLPYKIPIAIGVSILLGLSVFVSGFLTWKYLLFGIPVILVGISSTPVINTIKEKWGDLSYGVYIYGLPVQQTLVYFFKPSILVLIIASLIISGMMAYLSWRLIENPALSLKKKLKGYDGNV